MATFSRYTSRAATSFAVHNVPQMVTMRPVAGFPKTMGLQIPGPLHRGSAGPRKPSRGRESMKAAKLARRKLYPSVLQIVRNPCHASKGGGESTSREHLAAHMGVYAAHLRMGQAAQKIDVTSKAFFRNPKLVRSSFQNLRKRPRTKA